MTARMPQPVSAQGACSREEPQPKLSPASMIWQPWYSGWLSGKSGSGRAIGEVAPLVEKPFSQTLLYRSP